MSEVAHIRRCGWVRKRATDSSLSKATNQVSPELLPTEIRCHLGIGHQLPGMERSTHSGTLLFAAVCCCCCDVIPEGSRTLSVIYILPSTKLLGPSALFQRKTR